MRLQEILNEGSFEWDTDNDKNTFISLKGLVNKNNGVFKSIKQQQFVKNVTIAREPERDVAFAKSNYGVDVGEDENMIVVSAMTQHAAYGSRGLVPVFYGFVLDSSGVIRFYRIGVSGNLRDGAGPNAKKTKLKWERPANIDVSHLEKSEEEQKREFKAKLGMSEGNYIGTEGERMKFELTLVAKKYLSTTNISYNVSSEKYWNMYEDKDGNVIYHTGKQGPEKGDKVTGSATIKMHLVNKKGQKVTVVIRPRFKLVEPEEVTESYGYEFKGQTENEILRKLNIINVFKAEGWSPTTKRDVASHVDEFIDATLGWPTIPRFQTLRQKQIRQALINQVLANKGSLTQR